jgi:hypothetical protein
MSLSQSSYDHAQAQYDREEQPEPVDETERELIRADMEYGRMKDEQMFNE